MGERAPPRRRWSAEIAAAAVLCVALVVATYPAWRVLRLGERPTLEELLSVVCGRTPRPAAASPGPPAWIRRLQRDG